MSTFDKNVVYEVTLQVNAEVVVEYLEWLRQHIQEMLSLPGFISVQLMKVTDPVVDGCVVYCTRYLLQNQQALDAYFQHHAERMRSDGLTKFAGEFSATRRVLSAVDASTELMF